MATSRKRNNKIHGLWDEEDRWVNTPRRALQSGERLLLLLFENKAIPHRLDVGFVPSFSPIKIESPSFLNHTSPLHLRLFVVLPNYFRYLLFASIS